jgi:hypothetical protein
VISSCSSTRPHLLPGTESPEFPLFPIFRVQCRRASGDTRVALSVFLFLSILLLTSIKECVLVLVTAHLTDHPHEPHLPLHPALRLHQRACPRVSRRPPHGPPAGAHLPAHELSHRHGSQRRAGRAQAARKKPRMSVGRSSRWCTGRVSRRRGRGSQASLIADGMETEGTPEMGASRFHVIFQTDSFWIFKVVFDSGA